MQNIFSVKKLLSFFLVEKTNVEYFQNLLDDMKTFGQFIFWKRGREPAYCRAYSLHIGENEKKN